MKHKTQNQLFIELCRATGELETLRLFKSRKYNKEQNGAIMQQNKTVTKAVRITPETNERLDKYLRDNKLRFSTWAVGVIEQVIKEQ